MGRPKDAKVWNEDLVRALEAREEQARREGKNTSYTWRTGKEEIQKLRKDIYKYRTGTIVGLPHQKLTKRVHDLCVEIINGSKNVLPDGYVPQSAAEASETPQGNPYERDPYLKRLKRRSGSYAIMMAFHCSQETTLTKTRICQLAQPWCDEEMDSNFHAGRMYGAWKSNETLRKHHLIHCDNATRGYVEGRGFRTMGQNHYHVTANGKLFIKAMLKKFPLTQEEKNMLPYSQKSQRLAESPASFNNWNQHDNVEGLFSSATRSASTPLDLSPGKRKRRDELQATDEVHLKEWLLCAQVGDEKTFKVGKNRRKNLHDLCDRIMSKNPGLLLTHDSYGDSRQRTLRIHLAAKGLKSSGSVASQSRALPALSSPSLPDVKSLELDEPFGGSGRLLGRTTDRAIGQGRSAVEAARVAALERHAFHESRVLSEKKTKASAINIAEDDEDLKAAMRESLVLSYSARKPSFALETSEDQATQQAIAASLSFERQASQRKASARRALFKSNFSDSSDSDDLEAFRPVFSSSKRSAKGQRNVNSRSARDRKLPLTVSLAIDDEDAKPSASTSTYSQRRNNQVANKESRPIEIDLSDRDDDYPPPLQREEREKYEEDKSNKTIDLCDSKVLDTTPFEQNIDEDQKDDNGNDVIDLSESQALNLPAQPTVGSEQGCPTVDDDASDVDEKIVELSQDCVIVLDHQARGKQNSQPSKSHQLTFVIDDRERSRNHKPRQLRMDLTRIVKTGTIKSVWPRNCVLSGVEERSLSNGDFAFSTMDENGNQQCLGVALERKRIGDLVQRSVKGDHWRQFCKMRDSFGHAVFMVEYDTRQASQFSSEGEQDLASWNPFQTCIQDESSVFLYFGRSLFSHRAWKVVQTSSEQTSLRFVGALGLMAINSNKVKETTASTKKIGDERRSLQNRLTDASIPWQLARAVAVEIGSAARLTELYRECSTEACRLNLFTHLASFINLDEGLSGTAEGWSAAVYHAFFSQIQEPTTVRSIFSKHKGSVADHSQFLSALHVIPCPRTALEAVQLESFKRNQELSPRSVSVCLTDDMMDLMEAPKEDSFFTMSSSTKRNLGVSVPTITIQTHAGVFKSLILYIHVIDGVNLVETLQNSLSGRSARESFVKIAQDAAEGIKEQCHPKKFRKPIDRQLVLVRGLPPAIAAASKKAGCHPELAAFADMVQSSLMLDHDIVVIQAIRKQVSETKLILRQILLASLHYTYLVVEDR